MAPAELAGRGAAAGDRAFAEHGAEGVDRADLDGRAGVAGPDAAAVEPRVAVAHRAGGGRRRGADGVEDVGVDLLRERVAREDAAPAAVVEVEVRDEGRLDAFGRALGGVEDGVGGAFGGPDAHVVDPATEAFADAEQGGRAFAVAGVGDGQFGAFGGLFAVDVETQALAGGVVGDGEVGDLGGVARGAGVHRGQGFGAAQFDDFAGAPGVLEDVAGHRVEAVAVADHAQFVVGDLQAVGRVFHAAAQDAGALAVAEEVVSGG